MTEAEPPTVEAATTVVIAHPSSLMRDAAHQAIIGSELRVVGVCDSLAELQRVVAKAGPKVALIASQFGSADMSLIIASVITAGTRVLVLSDGKPDEESAVLLLAGASGLISAEDTSMNGLVQAIESVAAGRTALHPDVAMAVFAQWRAMRSKESADPAGRLSAREIQVLEAGARGQSTREISRSLGIAEKTIEAHRSRLYAKLGAKNQSHAIAIALERGLLPTPEGVPAAAVSL